MSTVRSITIGCQTEDGTEVAFETTDNDGIEGALLVAQIVGSNKRVYMSAEDLRMLTEFINREIHRADPEPF